MVWLAAAPGRPPAPVDVPGPRADPPRPPRDRDGRFDVGRRAATVVRDADDLRDTEVFLQGLGLVEPDVDLVEAMRSLLGFARYVVVFAAVLFAATFVIG